jgi:hypothetical protein
MGSVFFALLAADSPAFLRHDFCGAQSFLTGDENNGRMVKPIAVE